MKPIRLDGDVDLEGFRQAARRAAARGLEADAIRFVTGGAGEESDLFAEPEIVETVDDRRTESASLHRFLAIADLVSRHREPARYDLLYAALLRLREAARLLEIASDPLVRQLEDMERAVRRDQHTMTAFVRFREIETPDGARFVAWFEPAHFIEELTAPFFVDRFASMRFAILTPRTIGSFWDGGLALRSRARGARTHRGFDDFAGAWDIYYRSIFNPARLMKRAMLEGDAEEILGRSAGNASDPGHVLGSSASRGADGCGGPVQDRPRRREKSPLNSPKPEN